MLFNSMQYAGFLAVVIALYWGISKFFEQDPALGRRARQVLLLVSSYLFYATWDWRFCFLLAAITPVNCLARRRLASTDDPARRRFLLGVSIASTIGVLGILKYLNFFTESVASLLRTFGLEQSWTLSILVPLGISFFTLHTLSYVVDIYRRELEPTNDPIVFGVFVAYFPQLLAGPLTRGKRMIPQFAELPMKTDRVKWQHGLELILIGLFQKVAIADALAPFTRQIFAGTGQGTDRNFLMLLVGMLASVVQFVLDYAGYSNIARGSSKLLGIELPYNFRQPITRSRNFQDYWRRHNMTLMAWFRDYVMRPLRKRRESRLRASVLLIIVFTLSGLWHVASWGWVAWGLFVGVWVAGEVQVNRYREADRVKRAKSEVSGAPGAAGTTTLTAPATEAPVRANATLSQVAASVYVVAVLGFSMVLFRSPSLGTALSYYGEVFRFSSASFDWDSFLTFVYAVVAVVVVDHREHHLELSENQSDPPTFARAAMWGVMLTLIIVHAGSGSAQPFVYFQF
jgi:D-alanyl-lipoteichoic acid acyltransferase DltB (MBOAT superfamily)